MRCWPCCPASSPRRWRWPPPPNCATHAMTAARYYETVWRTDHSYVSAAFGLARQRAARPETGRVRSRRSTRCPPSQRISPPRARPRSRFCSTAEPREPGRADAARCRQARGSAEPANRRHQAGDDSAAGARRGVGLAAGRAHATTPRGCSVPAFDEPGIRTGMERCYRELAHETTGMWERIALVEKANAIRPRTRV